MNRFTADFSSSVNSTDTPPRPKHLFSNIPPLASTTPLVPPPSTIFGSSQLGSGTGVSKLRFSTKNVKITSRSPPTTTSRSIPRTKNGTPARPKSRPVTFGSSAYDDVPEEDQEWEDEDGDEDMREDPILPVLDRPGAAPTFAAASTTSKQPPVRSLMRFSTNSETGMQPSQPGHRSLGVSKISRLSRKGDEKVIIGLTRDLAGRTHPAPLGEEDEVIMATEQIIRQLHEEVANVQDTETLEDTLSVQAYELILEWRRHGRIDRPSLDSNSIGPPSSTSPFAKASYVASLLLALYHPPAPLDENQTPKRLPVPQILLDWLDNYHVSYEQLYRSVLSTNPNCTTHPLFWDAIQSLTLRGKFQEVMRLLADADFNHAATAVDDGADQEGYRGIQLQTIQGAILRARQILNTCPVIQDGDWEVNGADWDIFRRHIQSELEHLADLAAPDDDDDLDTFEAENFNIRKPAFGLLGKTRQKNKSNLPWTIYQSLKIMYSILLGSADEIMAQSQDWLEAAVGLTVWWDGAENAKITQWSFDVSRATNKDVNEDQRQDPYLSRLRDSFLCVTDPTDNNSFQMNAMSVVEIGLGAVLQGSVDGVLVVLQTLSQCVASAIAEVGTVGGWILGATSDQPDGLNSEDLRILNYGNKQDTDHDVSKDDILLTYSEALFHKDQLQSSDGTVIEGWELSIAIATRFDDVELTRSTIENYLDQLQIVDEGRAEKLMNLCSDLGLQEETRRISERFGDYLVNNSTHNYGTALLCYARSHSEAKIRKVVDLLNSYCLVESTAYPPEMEMDEGLLRLVKNPKSALADIAELDPTAAQYLQFYLAGYACLRRFYSLRDQDSTLPSTSTTFDSANNSSKKPLRPIARKRAAAKALVAAITSAADSIYGGLYDPDRQTAIQVDALFTLLGEATALLSSPSSSNSSPTNPTPIYTSSQLYTLLATIEDLSCVTSQIYGAGESCLLASLRNYQGSARPPSPRAMLKKSMSSTTQGTSNSNSATGTNFSFSLMGSEMLTTSAGSNPSNPVMTGGSGSEVLISHNKSAGHARSTGPDVQQRGWDWRDRFSGENVRGDDILMTLRRGIALELALVDLDTD